jgi:hypothetical protein
MNIPKKPLSIKRSPAVVLDEGQHSFKGAGLASLTNSTQLKLNERGTGKRAFFEDFRLEHSLSGTQVAPIDLAGSF